jgi:predicted HTH domain antitoxin
VLGCKNKLGEPPMSLVIPDELLKAARMSEAELMQEIVLMLFGQEKLTLGRASC